VSSAPRSEGQAPSKRPLPVVLIAVEKGISTLAIFAGAAFAFLLRRHPYRNPVSMAVLMMLGSYPQNHIVVWLARHVPPVSPDKALAAGIGLTLWGGLFAAETIGVWQQAAWGSLLVIVETAAFLPIEAWNIARHPRPLEFVTTPINLAILGYLVYAYKKQRRKG
jgi:uncharacterized membrane protein (DUF2068 family)